MSTQTIQKYAASAAATTAARTPLGASRGEAALEPVAEGPPGSVVVDEIWLVLVEVTATVVETVGVTVLISVELVVAVETTLVTVEVTGLVGRW